MHSSLLAKPAKSGKLSQELMVVMQPGSFVHTVVPNWVTTKSSVEAAEQKPNPFIFFHVEVLYGIKWVFMVKFIRRL